MLVYVVFGLLVISGLTLNTRAFIFKAPGVDVQAPPATDYENATYSLDSEGHLNIDMDELKNVSDSQFSTENDVIFELYTLKNPTELQVLSLKNFSMVFNSNFNWRCPTRIFIHGWNSGYVLTPEFTDAFLVKGKHNVNLIAVNWAKGSDTYFYHMARRLVNDVAAYIAIFLDEMNLRMRMKFSDLTIIGHSLGAHISGVVGKKVRRGKIAKILGLDPASPLFNYDDVENRLADTDATYVEVIHTCTSTLGISRRIGHADFHPNGGKSQPGCGWDVAGACAHSRSFHFYFESVYSPDFYAIECGSLENVQAGQCSIINKIAKMGGEPGNKFLKGVFYLETNDKSPYAQGRMGLLQTIKKTSKIISILSGLWNYISESNDDHNLTTDIEESIIGL